MEKLKKLSLVNKLIILMVILFAGLSQVKAAGSATLRVAPSSGNYQVGDTIVVTIQENSGTEEVNAVQADLSYSSTLQHVRTDKSTSAFALTGADTASGGTIRLALASATNRTGLQTVAVITFRAVGAGNASINFLGTSMIVRASDVSNVLGTTTGANFTIANKPTPPPTPSTQPSTTAKPPTTVQSNRPQTPTTPTSPSSSVSSRSSSSPITNPVPTAPNQSVQGASANKYMIAVKVLDEYNKAVVGARVTMDGSEVAISDATGIASFVNVSAGKHTLKTVIKGKEKSQVIEVKGINTTTPEEYSIQLPRKSFFEIYKFYIVLAVGLLILLPTMFILWRKFRKNSYDDITKGTPLVEDSVLPTTNSQEITPTFSTSNIGNVISPNSTIPPNPKSEAQNSQNTTTEGG